MPKGSQVVVVGTGPNGLAAAITVAQAGVPVAVFEANETIGGGAQSSELTLPGFVHDVCSAVHPMVLGSPFFSTLPLARHGLEWIQPNAPLAHPLDDGTAVILERSISSTCEGLGEDASAYGSLMNPLVERWADLASMILRPPLRVPRHPLLLARFGIPALMPANRLARFLFKDQRARALFSGIAAHSMLSLNSLLSASFGLMLGVLAHAVGWPIARGGAQKISDSLSEYLRELGGRILIGQRIRSIADLPHVRAILLDVSPRQLLGIAGDHLPSQFRKKLLGYRYGPGVFKLDYALDSPVPWTARECLRAGTVHLGGTIEEITESEETVAQGKIPERPFVLVSQPTLFDPTRAQGGKHILWAYCHVPNGATVDMTSRIEGQIERFAPGFRNHILAFHSCTPKGLELHNSNYIGGDINGGALDIRQFIARPSARLDPYSTPVPGLYICSASTPPGGGVHGMCGHNAALSALRYLSHRGHRAHREI